MFTGRFPRRTLFHGRRHARRTVHISPPRRLRGLWRPIQVTTLLTLSMMCVKCASPGCGSTGELEATMLIPAARLPTGLASEELIQWAQDDPVGLLTEGLSRCRGGLGSYDGEFILRERIDGQLNGPVTSHFKFRSEPFSVVMRRLRGRSRITRVLYVEGRNEGRMIVRPSGLLGKLAPNVEVDPHGLIARKHSRRAITDFGLENTLLRLVAAYNRPADQGHLELECLGLSELGGRAVVTLQKTSPTGKTVTDLDVEMLLPLRVQEYTPDDLLVASYQYTKLRFNCRFGDRDFSREVNGLSE